MHWGKAQHAIFRAEWFLLAHVLGINLHGEQNSQFCVEICRGSTQMFFFSDGKQQKMFLEKHKRYGIVSDLTQNVFGLTQNFWGCFCFDTKCFWIYTKCPGLFLS